MIKAYLSNISTMMNKKNLVVEKILSEGISFTDENYNKDDSLIYSGTINSQIKQCYKNSLLLALVNDSVKYYEGYYLFDDIPIPFEHAWNVNQENELIDSTVAIMNSERVPVEYLGIEIPKKILRKYLKTNQYLTALQYYILILSKQNQKTKSYEIID